ncbi:pantetheine-phosphate adenylyltransferase [Bacteroides sp.]|uniref:pantetheine-phosphate adenylyltransferase n=1 Tax=Bacteroides sp. TaxID=29523 RepID=UPI0026121ABF|nr:pantetheine-phosphate adenylyltransferase [Bacteroides sp.]MDD3040552.1 pantetheine-phosphate adenylyltransferase [Bacteroides sp.]
MGLLQELHVPIEDGWGTVYSSPMQYFVRTAVTRGDKDIMKIHDIAYLEKLLTRLPLRHDWKYVRDHFEYSAIKMAIEQHPNLRTELVISNKYPEFKAIFNEYPIFTACFPGSFDPFHYGHLSVVISFLERAKNFELIILVAENPKKKYVLTPDERMDVIHATLPVEVRSRCMIDYTTGSVVEYMKENRCNTIIKGVRNTSDFQMEAELATFNSMLDSRIQTMLLPQSDNSLLMTSSTNIKELIRLGAPVDGLIHDKAIEYLRSYK